MAESMRMTVRYSVSYGANQIFAFYSLTFHHMSG